jgi:GT2 family glycosyltransferase
MPTRDGLPTLQRAVDFVLEKTSYPDYELVVVDNGSGDRLTLDYLDGLVCAGKARVIVDPRPFNFSAINNRAVEQTAGEYCLFLNSDVETISCDWLTDMARYMEIEAVGAVGAKLYYPDDTVQHAGIVLGVLGLAGHAHRHFPKDADGYLSRLRVAHNVSACTAACLLVRRKAFEQAGGFDEQLAVAFNDVDLCLRIRRAGYRIVFAPEAELYHHESLTRGYEDTPEKAARFRREVDHFRRKWHAELARGDPYYNPNLTQDAEDFAFRYPVSRGSSRRS